MQTIFRPYNKIKVGGSPTSLRSGASGRFAADVASTPFPPSAPGQKKGGRARRHAASRGRVVLRAVLNHVNNHPNHRPRHPGNRLAPGAPRFPGGQRRHRHHRTVHQPETRAAIKGAPWRTMQSIQRVFIQLQPGARRIHAGLRGRGALSGQGIATTPVAVALFLREQGKLLVLAGFRSYQRVSALDVAAQERRT